MKEDVFSWDGTAFNWHRKDVDSLVKAVSGRMPKLDELSIRGSSLRGYGSELAKIPKTESLSSVELVATQLSVEDGNILLSSIQEGHLDHLVFLNLLENNELNPLSYKLKAACENSKISLEFNPAPRQAGSDVASTMATFIPETSEGTTMDIGSLLTPFLSLAGQQPHSQSSKRSTDAEATEKGSPETTNVGSLPSHQPQQQRQFNTATEANEFSETSAVEDILTSKESKDEVRNTKYRHLEQQFIH